MVHLFLACVGPIMINLCSPEESSVSEISSLDLCKNGEEERELERRAGED